MAKESAFSKMESSTRDTGSVTTAYGVVGLLQHGGTRVITTMARCKGKAV